ncbi:hypothetical protein RhiirA1_454969 [Rhizophagus irregularis]|uniref:Uncharacterized protein n=1 Tax=Rhizophagus irregularis TaxID=588596 RepID=A0A2I1ES65_9GLOM|nr:hypothetical protein RhiirA1_454969 [Rhizophagus irregularis]PKY24951.1 hypothetical protein RhiirB3_439701 [Rhizophagus irregularis]CAB5385713.1 unnamed protein product [Rhizophagus irregularis]
MKLGSKCIYCYEYLSSSIDKLTRSFNERLQMESDIENEFDIPSSDDISLEQAEKVECNNNKDIDNELEETISGITIVMGLLKETFEDERKFENFIQDVSSTLHSLQRLPTKNSKTSEWESKMFGNEYKQSDNPSCHCMECSCPLLYDQHWQTSEIFDFSQSADKMAVLTSKRVVEVDNDFRANTQGPVTQEPATQETIMADSNKCIMEVEVPENCKVLIQSIANRKQECQKTINKATSGSQFRELSSLSSECEWEFEKESGALAVRELCQDVPIVSSSITETQATNQNTCNNDNNTRNATNLHELPHDHEPQQDLTSLLKLLNNKYPYRIETNKNVLTNGEIRLFAGMYGITDFHLILVTCDASVFWLEDPDSIIYFWSRIDDSMIRGGNNLKDALINYLFHQENLYYVDEITHELVPINAYDKEAEEWAKSPKAYFDIDEIKASLKYESKMGGKKKQQKKKKKKKKKKKH